MKLLLASNNPGKLRELAALLQGLPIELLRPADLGLRLDVEESGDTYAENAARKARAFARAAGLTAIADDSGLEIPALGYWPGVHSVRFAGPAADEARRCQLILDRVAGLTPVGGQARFVSVVVIADPRQVLVESVGVLNGEIVPPRGAHGFGYDPIFQPGGETRTLAELGPEEKNAISHRADAVRALVPFLRRLAVGAG